MSVTAQATILLQAALLAQSGGTTARASGQVLVLVGVLIAAAIIGGVVVLAVRRRLMRADSDAAQSVGLAESLRRMRDQGVISPEEYDRVRKTMARKAAGKPAGPASPRTADRTRGDQPPDTPSLPPSG